MWPDRVSNPGPLTYESGALPIVLGSFEMDGFHSLHERVGVGSFRNSIFVKIKSVNLMFDIKL